MKRPGHCTLCEKQIFESVDPPIPNSDAWRVRFLLSDETFADITFCEKCLPRLSRNKKKIWGIVMERFDYDETKRDKPAKPEVEKMLGHIREQHLVKELSRARWSELL